MIRVPLPFALLSGVLVAAAFYVPHGWPLIFIALVPLVHAVRLSRSSLEAFLAGLSTGVIITGATAFWMFDTVLLPASIGLSPEGQLAAIAISLGLIVVFTAPAVGAWAVFLRALSIECPTDLFIASVLWVAFEHARMYGFNIVTYAPEVSNPPFWSVGFLGYALTDSSSWLQFAWIGGVALLSLIAAFASLLAYRFLFMEPQQGGRRALPFAALAAGVALVSVLPLAEWRARMDGPSSRTVEVAMMSLYAATDEELRAAARQTITEEERERVLSLGGDIVLLPEGLGIHAEVTRVKGSAAPRIIADSGLARNLRGESAVVAYATDPETLSAVPVREKMVLTPQGEYLIAIFTKGMDFLGLGQTAHNFSESYGRTSGSTGDPIALADGARASVMFCFEMFKPGLAGELKEAHGSDLLLAMVSHSRFEQSRKLELDTLRFMRAQAVEAAMPAVVSSHTAPAFALDRYGREIARMGEGRQSEYRVIEVELPD